MRRLCASQRRFPPSSDGRRRWARGLADQYRADEQIEGGIGKVYSALLALVRERLAFEFSSFAFKIASLYVERL